MIPKNWLVDRRNHIFLGGGRGAAVLPMIHIAVRGFFRLANHWVSTNCSQLLNGFHTPTYPYAPCIVYLPTFGRFFGHMLVNVPYMEHIGYVRVSMSRPDFRLWHRDFRPSKAMI